MNAKLDTGRVFERIFSLYGSQFTLLIPVALVLFLPVALLSGLVSSSVAGILAAFLTFLLSIVAGYWYQGIVVEATRDILDGRRDHTIGSLFSSAAPFIGPLFVVGVLAGIAITIGLFLLVIPGLFLLTIWAVIVPVIVIERAGIFDSFGRSRELVRGSGWQVFGVLVVLFLISAVVGGVLGAIVGGFSDESFIGYAIANLLSSVLLAPLSALAATVIYVELRRIKGDPLIEDEAPSPLPRQEGAPLATNVSERPPEPSDAPPQAGGREAPPAGPQAPPR